MLLLSLRGLRVGPSVAARPVSAPIAAAEVVVLFRTFSATSSLRAPPIGRERFPAVQALQMHQQAPPSRGLGRLAGSSRGTAGERAGTGARDGTAATSTGTSGSSAVVASASKEVKELLIAYDCSGSTNHASHYHSRTQDIVRDLLAAHPLAQPEVLLWNDSFEGGSLKRLAEMNSRRSGSGGTDPSMIVAYLDERWRNRDLKDLHLVIISDGQVGVWDVDRCDEAMRAFGAEATFASVTAHLIGDEHSANMSITAPFTRACPHEVYTYFQGQGVERVLAATVTSDSFAALEAIGEMSTVAKFDAGYATLRDATIARTMGKLGDARLHERLVALKRRLVADAARSNDPALALPVAALSKALLRKDESAAAAAARRIVDEYYGGSDTSEALLSWSARLDQLVAMSTGAIRGVFSVKSARLQRAPRIAPEAAALVDSDAEGGDTDLEDGGGDDEAATAIRDASSSMASAVEATMAFPCPPVPLEGEDDDLIMLVYQSGVPVLSPTASDDNAIAGGGAGAGKALHDRIFNNPLELLNHPELVSRFLKWVNRRPMRLSTFRDHTSLRSSNGHLVEGGICLAPTEEACAATRWSLARIFTGGKLIGNEDLWFAAAMKMLRPRLEALEYAPVDPDEDIWERVSRPSAREAIRAFEQQMRYRLETHSSALSLGGRPEYVTTRAPLRDALWFVLNGGALLKLPAARDPARAHLSCLTHMAPLLELSGCQRSYEGERHILRTRVLGQMLGMVKSGGGSGVTTRHFQQSVRALTQRALRVPKAISLGSREELPQWILLDGPATPLERRKALAELPGLWQELPVRELTHLAESVHPSRAMGDIDIHEVLKELPRNLFGRYEDTDNDWADAAAKVEWEPLLERVRIAYSEATCRPLCRPGGVPWLERARQVYGKQGGSLFAISDLFSVDNHYGNAVAKHGRFLGVMEFLVYLYNRLVVNGGTGRSTLPANALQFAESVIADHAPLLHLGAAEYRQRRNASTVVAERVQIEAGITKSAREDPPTSQKGGIPPTPKKSGEGEPVEEELRFFL